MIDYLTLSTGDTLQLSDDSFPDDLIMSDGTTLVASDGTLVETSLNRMAANLLMLSDSTFNTSDFFLSDGSTLQLSDGNLLILGSTTGLNFANVYAYELFDTVFDIYSVELKTGVSLTKYTSVANLITNALAQNTNYGYVKVGTFLYIYAPLNSSVSFHFYLLPPFPLSDSALIDIDESLISPLIEIFKHDWQQAHNLKANTISENYYEQMLKNL